MPKPNAIQWLEEQTGEVIDYTPESARGNERHLSVRLPDELAAGLDALAVERGLTTSQLVRDLLGDVVRQRSVVRQLDARALVERLDADVAEVRRRLAG